MREILFRGKNVDGGEWVYGWLVQDDYASSEPPEIGEYSASGFHGEYVDPDTVGESTGLTDTDETRIFEGDIIKIGGPHGCGAMGVVCIGEYSILPGDLPYNFGAWVNWFYEPDGVFGMRRQELLFWTKEHRIEICGNIHDNPELLTVSQTSHAEGSR